MANRVITLIFSILTISRIIYGYSTPNRIRTSCPTSHPLQSRVLSKKTLATITSKSKALYGKEDSRSSFDYGIPSPPSFISLLRQRLSRSNALARKLPLLASTMGVMSLDSQNSRDSNDATLKTSKSPSLSTSYLPSSSSSSSSTTSTSSMQATSEMIGGVALDTVSNLAQYFVNPPIKNETQRYLPVAAALNKLQKDMELLDDAAGKTPQLSSIELTALLISVMISALAPAFFSMKVVEVLVPSMAALSASIGISAEYVGKVAVSNGKEVAALAIQAAAESETVLAQAERIKAVLPLCVGIGTTASAFALLAPNFVEEISLKYSFSLMSEIYLICPLVAVLSAAVAGLATQESRNLASKAIGIGNRRFASSKSVGRTWLSSTEQVELQSARITGKWLTFAVGVLPGPVIATFCPGSLSFKSIVCAAIAAAQAAYYLALCEYTIACAVDAVALKARSAAVADTYANQGSRAGSILPFTSALAGLCAAASAAAAELLPLVSIIELQSALALVFPSGAALFAAAAAVSKARCEVDAAAASEAAATGLSGDNFVNYKDPYDTLVEIIGLTINNTWAGIKMKTRRIKSIIMKGQLWYRFKKWASRIMFGNGKSDKAGNTPVLLNYV